MATQTVPCTRAGKYVTFQIARHYFAIEARRVRQVTPAKDVLPLDHPLDCVRGALLMRGRRVPVVDIRDRLGLPLSTSHARNSVMLVDIGISGLGMIGIVADRVTDVVEFRDRDFRENIIQMRPHGRPYGRPKTLLDIEGLFTELELAALRSVC
jgi:chemotaxis signal transduction protein